MEQVLIYLLAVSALLCGVLTTLTVARKVRRDRKEALYLARRTEFREVLLHGSPHELRAALHGARRGETAQIDLLTALQAVAPQLEGERRVVVHEAVVAARLDRALAQQLGSRDPVRRAAAAMLLASFQLPDAESLIAPLLRDRDGDVRLAAVRALAAIANDGAAYHLIAALGMGTVEPERVIERLGNLWAVPAVLDTLEGHPGRVPPGAPHADAAISWRSIGASLARALGLAADPRAEPALLALLRTGGDEERIAAARALGTAGTRAAVPDLEAALGDGSWQVRAQAARSLGHLGATASVPALAPRLGDPAWWVRAAAADALVELGDPGLAALREALVNADRYARDRAREALTMHHLGADA